jgi:hypothetical protein
MPGISRVDALLLCFPVHFSNHEKCVVYFLSAKMRCTFFLDTTASFGLRTQFSGPIINREDDYRFFAGLPFVIRIAVGAQWAVSDTTVKLNHASVA